MITKLKDLIKTILRKVFGIQILKVNNNPEKKDIIWKLKSIFKEISKFDKHYIIKENVLFPLIEKEWTDYRCLQIMWSFHDDIRSNLKNLLNLRF